MTKTPENPPVNEIDFSMPVDVFVLLTRFLLDAEDPAGWSKANLERMDEVFGLMDDAAIKVDPSYATVTMGAWV